jgi:SAM-dependent methyltransferase
VHWTKGHTKLAALLTLQVTGLTQPVRTLLGKKVGDTHRPEYCHATLKQLKEYLDLAGPWELGSVLELGPGSSAATGLHLRGMGADQVAMVDAFDLAEKNVRELVDHALWIETHRTREQGLLPFSYVGWMDGVSHEQALTQARCSYGSKGLESLRLYGEISMDTIVSNAVLEHVRPELFDPLVKELFRLSRPGARSVHVIDFRDHLYMGAEHWTIPVSIWESSPNRRRAAYVNRFSPEHILGLFKAAGFEVLVDKRDLWPEIPLPRESLAPPFKNWSEMELRTRGQILVLERPRTIKA